MPIAQPISSDLESGAHLFEPIIENRPSTLPSAPLRVVAFNAQGGVHFDGILRCFGREPLRSASVILLCEADLGLLRSARRKVASELAQALGMSCAYVPEFGFLRTDGSMSSFLGNAMLSREPLENVVAIPLPKVSTRYPRVPRSFGRVTRVGNQVAIVATIRIRGKTMQISVAHLDSRTNPRGRDLQMATLLERFPAGGPAIFGGDFNTTTVELNHPAVARIVLREMLLNSRRFRHPHEHEPLLARLGDAGFAMREANVEGCPTFTFARIVPPWMRPKLDWIALRDLDAVAGSAPRHPRPPQLFGLAHIRSRFHRSRRRALSSPLTDGRGRARAIPWRR